MRWINTLPVIASIAILQGCGGGSDSGSAIPSTDQYVVYNGNANRHVILDGAGTQFAVKVSDQKLVQLSIATELNGLLVASNGDITRNGQKIAAVILTAQGGQTIASLACTGPAPNFGAMTISVTAQGWTYRCASNTGAGGNEPGGGVGGGTGGGTGGGGTAGQSADQCVRLSPHPRGGLGITNTCNVAIEYSYCNLRAVSSAALFQCRAQALTTSPTGYVYQRGGSTLAPGNTAQILETAEITNQKTWVKACVYLDIPLITGFNTAVINENSLATGYCLK